jgi:hypothetical protein
VNLSTLKSIATAIGSFAPTLATMLGGPLAGTAVSALEQALGLQKGAGPDAITQVVQGGLTPEAIAAVRAADEKHAEAMGQQKVDLAKINADFDIAFAKIGADDREGARQRQVEVKDHTPEILAYGTTTGFFGILGWMLMHGVPKESDVLMVMLGSLGTAWTAIVGYYFGSSIGARKGADALAQIAKQP